MRKEYKVFCWTFWETYKFKIKRMYLIKKKKHIMTGITVFVSCHLMYPLFQVGVNSRGIIQYLNYNLYQDNGHVVNMPFSFLVLNAYNNCYDKSRWQFNCYNAITDTPKNDWLRAPGKILIISEFMSIDISDTHPSRLWFSHKDKQT